MVSSRGLLCAFGSTFAPDIDYIIFICQLCDLYLPYYYVNRDSWLRINVFSVHFSRQLRLQGTSWYSEQTIDPTPSMQEVPLWWVICFKRDTVLGDNAQCKVIQWNTQQLGWFGGRAVWGGGPKSPMKHRTSRSWVRFPRPAKVGRF